MMPKQKTRYNIGDKVKMTDVFHKYDYGIGTIVDIGYYFGLSTCYFVKHNRGGGVCDYPANQLKLVERKKRQ